MKFRNLLAVVACGLTLASCGQEKKEPVKEETKVNVGIGYVVALTEGTAAQADITAVMVAFDKDGKIVDSRLDVVQVKFKANEAKDGLELNLKEEKLSGSRVLTKCELGTGYNMAARATKGEVDHQIEAYADWAQGKTVAELKADLSAKEGSESTDAVYAGDADLLASCTIKVSDFAAAYEVAYDNKSAASYVLDDGFKTGIAMNAQLAYNYGKPSVEVSCDIAGVVVANGKVNACAIDAVVVHPTINAEDGTIALDPAQKYHTGSTAEKQVFLSKKDLGEAYAMRVASPTQKEWFEQAAAIEADVVGLEVSALADKTTFEGATITVSSYASAIARAAEYATKDFVGPQAA